MHSANLAIGENAEFLEYVSNVGKALECDNPALAGQVVPIQMC